MRAWTRRDFVKTSAMGLAVTVTGKLGWPQPQKSTVSMVSVGAGGREEAIQTAIELVGAPALSGKSVVLKPNFNSAHAFPGSTHPETLGILSRMIQELGASDLTIADRSGMGSTRGVMEEIGAFKIAEEHNCKALPLQDLPAEGWVHIEHPDLHWSQGFHLGKVFRDADAIVQTCCLKTHRFGGHFTLSLKNTVGMVAKRVPGIDHDFMRELHGSDHQRRMIAELNLSYEPAIVVMDAVECFTNRGPENGNRAQPNLILASTDRVALDAVGVSILRDHGTTENVSKGKVFELEQIKRASELGIGVDRADRVEIVPEGAGAKAYAEKLMEIMAA